MFRRFMLALPVAGSLLTGCATTPADIQTTVQQIQATAVAVCGFLPTAATIAAILSAGNPLVTSVSAVANAICQAVTATPPLAGKRRMRGVPMVNGVVVHGRFVK